MKSKLNLNDPATKGDILKLDARIDKIEAHLNKSDSRVETMAEQLDWLYRQARDKPEQDLIHHNRHEEVENQLVDHEGRIVKVENFVQMVTT